MTELSFLIDLLLNHKLPKATKDALAERIKGLSTTNVVVPVGAKISPAMLSNQVPSMQRIMERNPDLLPQQFTGPPHDQEQRDLEALQQRAPQPVAVIAQTPAAVAAINSRQQAISESMAGKVDKVSGRPRKF